MRKITALCLKLLLSLMIIAGIFIFDTPQTDLESWQQKPHVVTLGKESPGVEKDLLGNFHIPGQPYRAIDIREDNTIVFEKYMPEERSDIWTNAVIFCKILGLLSVPQIIAAAKKRKNKKRIAHTQSNPFEFYKKHAL